MRPRAPVSPFERIRAGSATPRTGRPRLTRPWVALVIAGLGVMMSDLNMTLVAVASPAIERELDTGLSAIQWVSNGYLLALAVALIPAGRFGDYYGHRRMFLIGVAGFGLSSATIGLGGHVIVIITVRVVQGVCGALVIPAALGLLRSAFPPERFSMAIGVYGMVIGASTAAGPVAGGLLVEHFGWQAVFFVNVPISALILVLGLVLLRGDRTEDSPAGFDVGGIVLLSVSIFCLTWALINVDSLRTGNVGSWAYLIGSLLCFALFIVNESKAREPVLPLRLFRSVPLATGVALVVLLAFTLVGGLFVITFYLQNVLALSPTDTGLRLLPLTGTMIVASPLAGHAITKLGPRSPIVCGMLTIAVALFGISRLTSDSTALTTTAWFALLALGLAPVLVGSTSIIVGSAPAELSGVASGLQQSALQVGGGLGTAALGSVIATKISSELPGRWAAADLPPLSAEALRQASDAASVGNRPALSDASPQVVEDVAALCRDLFLSGMATTFAIAGAIAVIGALAAILIGPERPAGNLTEDQ